MPFVLLTQTSQHPTSQGPVKVDVVSLNSNPKRLFLFQQVIIQQVINTTQLVETQQKNKTKNRVFFIT